MSAVQYRRVRQVASVQGFLRVMGAIYAIAFMSFGVQAAGLVGSHGISPAGEYLQAAREAVGPRAYWVVPTVLWAAPNDWGLTAVWVLGAAFGLLALGGWKQRAVLAGCWVLWLSVCSAGQEFLSFQWDILLLEAGFLAIFADQSLVRVWLFRFLIFRLMFSSGVVKLTSGDAAWRGLTAMSFHYETQPLPTPLAWWMQQLPAAFQRISTVAMFGIELVVPLLFFAPRLWRAIGAWVTIGFQVLILLTGNYAYFNWLTIALCLWLLIEPQPDVSRTRAHRWVSGGLAATVGLLGILILAETVGIPVPEAGSRMMAVVGPLRLVNSYGLFAVMTTTRPEIVVEGTNDGGTWLAYEFRYKPGDLRRAPPVVAPHQPRLDWQMWFAALSRFEDNRWFGSFVEKLLRGEPAVLGLLARNPFPGNPPKYVRARLYLYHFTRMGEGGWWRRDEQGVYLRPVGLR